MRIQLPRSFSGRLTNEAWIIAGEYDVDDPALMGLGNYLVDTGHARVIAAEVVDGKEEEIRQEEVLTVDETPPDVVVMPSAEEPNSDVAVYEHQGRRIKAGKPK